MANLEIDAPARYAPGDDVMITAMPSRGALRVTARKHSRISGWWYEVRDAEGYTWIVPEDGIDRRAGERREA